MTEEFNSNNNPSGDLSLEAKIEGLLFVSPTLVTVKQLADALEVTPRLVEKALLQLGEAFSTRGIRLQSFRGKYQLTSAPEIATLVENLLNLDVKTTLTQASLETLAIVAYQQPITRPVIDSIRGVNSDSVLRGLLSKGLIDEAGRSEGPGRPILYVTTSEFLQHFGLPSLKKLPSIDIPENLEIHLEPEQPQLPLAD